MKGKTFGSFIAIIAIAGSLQGCAVMLWQHDFSRPTLEPNVKLFRVGDDVLVQYNEINEDNDHSWRRSYFLKQNTNAIAHVRMPVFIDAPRNSLTNPIPLLLPTSTNSTTFSLYAISKYDNGDPFFIVEGGKTNGPFELPVYRDTKQGNVERALLTPVALAADAAAVAAYLEVKSYDDEQEEKNSQPYLPVDSPRKKK